MGDTKKPKHGRDVQRQMFKDAGQQVEVPEEAPVLNDAELAVFHAASKCRANLDWKPNDLLLLAQYAQITVHLQHAQKTLRGEGDVVLNQRGTQIANPMFHVCDSLLKQQLSLSRALCLTTQSSGTAVSIADRAKQQKAVEKGKNNVTSFMASPD